jgi:hypothetical protein
MLSFDVVKYVAKSIRGEHEYKANIEVLTDKVYWLLENGLNDAILGWNEAKALEFQKYIKSQKRASRKTPRKKGELSTALSGEQVTQSAISSDEQVTTTKVS